MGTGQQAISTITQSANTAANLTIQTAAILGMALSKQDFDLISEWQQEGYIPESSFIVPSERMFEFRMLCDVNNIEFAEIPGQDYDNSEYIQIITKGPKASEQITDEFGNIIGINEGYEGDRPVLEKLVNQVMKEYQLEHNLDPERTDELGSPDPIDNDLKPGEAQRTFKNAMVVSVRDLSRSEMELLTKHADTIGVDTFTRYDYIADKYSVEFLNSEMKRNPNTPDIQSKGERLLQDFLIASSHPQINQIMKEQDAIYNDIRNNINLAQSGVLENDMVLVSSKELKIGEIPSEQIVLHTDGMASYMDHEKGESISFNLNTKEGLELFHEHYKSMESVILVNESDLSQISSTDKKILDQVRDAKSILDDIKYHSNHSVDDIRLSGLKASIYRQAEILAKDRTIEYSINENEGEKRFQTIEERVPNSDTIITDTILTATGDNDSDKQEEMKKLLDERMNSMKVTNATMFESIPQYMLKNEGELLNDTKKLATEAGQSQGLTAEEAKMYAKSTEIFQDKVNDDKSPMVNAETPVAQVEFYEDLNVYGVKFEGLEETEIFIDKNTGDDVTSQINSLKSSVIEEDNNLDPSLDDEDYDDDLFR